MQVFHHFALWHGSSPLTHNSAAAATIVKVYLIKDLDKHDDITWAWAPITLWYT